MGYLVKNDSAVGFLFSILGAFGDADGGYLASSVYMATPVSVGSTAPLTI